MATPSVGTFPSAFASTTPAYPLPSSSSTLSSSSSSSFSSAAFAPRAPPSKIPSPPSASRPAVVGRYSALVALIFDAILATGADPPPSEPQFADPTGYSTSNTITLSAFASSLRRRIVRAQSSPNALDDVEIDPDEDVPLIMAILLRERVLLPHVSVGFPLFLWRSAPNGLY
ncbi:hypothetical protein DFJ73DRAFT_367430 [Zopfochytrium polystomum]|nr:hypothetical protein DFJ73DRAFT_367430 [Zopfochytrium polystomum]